MERDIDLYRIIGQIESTVSSILENHRSCKETQKSEREKLFDLIDRLKSEIRLKADKKELDNLKDILNLDNSKVIKKNINILSQLVNIGATITIITAIIFWITKVFKQYVQ
jgi:hypothetical protein